MKIYRQPFHPNKAPIFTFQLLADVHVPTESRKEAYTVCFEKTLQDIKEIDPDTKALIFAGDNTMNGAESQCIPFYDVLKENAVAPNILIALGNHDVRECPWMSGWDEAYERYMRLNKEYMGETGGKTYFDRYIEGYHFIIMSTENSQKDTCMISDEQLRWLDEKIGESDKPTFVINHQALNDTHYNSNCNGGFGDRDADAKAVLAKHDNVIFISGHAHNGFGVCGLLDSPYGILLDLPALTCSENGIKTLGIAYHVEVYSDAICFRARNFSEGQWLPDYDQIILV